MSKATFGGLISKVEQKEEFGICDVCQKVYQLDVSFCSLSCPCCKTNAIRRGLTRAEAKNLLDHEYKELLS